MIVWLASYPRSGNTLLRIILNNVFDQKTCSKHDDINDIAAHAPTAETVGHQPLGQAWTDAYGRMKADGETHFVKTHDRPEDAGKAIYIARDGRSTCRSFYHYLKDFPHLGMQFSVRDVIAGFTPFGSWADHLDQWSPLDRPDTLLLKYEELLADPKGQIARLAGFVGLPAQHDWQNDFDRLHEMNPRFFRAGGKNDAATALDGEDLDFFWQEHGDWMTKLDYGQPSAQSGSVFRTGRSFLSTKGCEYYNLRERVFMAETELPKLQQARQDLEATTAALAAKLAGEVVALRETTDARDRLQTSLEEKDRQLSSLASEKSELLAKLEAVTTAASISNQQAQAERQIWEAERKAWQIERHGIEAERQARKVDLEQFEAQRQSWLLERQGLETERHAWQREREQLVAQVDANQASIAELRREQAESTQQADALRKQLQEALVRSRIVNTQLAQAEVEIKRLGADFQDRTSVLRTELDDERRKVADLHVHLQQSTAIAAELAANQQAQREADHGQARALAAALLVMEQRVQLLMSSRLMRFGWKLGQGSEPWWADASRDELKDVLARARMVADSAGPLPTNSSVSPEVMLEQIKAAAPAPQDAMDLALQHLCSKGFNPRVVLDVGAAKGYWSLRSAWRWKKAEYFMIDPLAESEPDLKAICADDGRFHYVLTAVGDKPGELVMNVTPDCDGSSLLEFPEPDPQRQRRVPIATLDQLLESGQIKPPELVKMDVQGFEVNALQGGQKLFDTAQVFIIEANLFAFMPGCPRLHELVQYMAERKFFPFDFAGSLRRPFENDLGQVDVVFVRGDSALVASHRWG